jgi:hypothetical protein
MTLTDLQADVTRYLEFEAQPAYTSAPDQIAKINEALGLLCEAAKPLFYPASTYTVTAGVNKFSISSTIFEPYDVWIDGRLLFTDSGQGAESGFNTITDRPNYLTESAGTVQRWYYLPEGAIGLWPTPAVGAVATVSGYGYHTDLVSGTDVINLPRALLTPLAKWAAGLILEPRASGSSEEKRQKLISEAIAVCTDWKERHVVRKATSMVRGATIRSGWARVGR